MVRGYDPTNKGITPTKEAPIYRIGQGATDALPNWTLVANACQKAYDKNSKGCQIQDPTRTIVQQAPGKCLLTIKILCTMGRKLMRMLKNLWTMSLTTCPSGIDTYE
eukprot:5901908-Ditylum_brightwellii.AAC.1